MVRRELKASCHFSKMPSVVEACHAAASDPYPCRHWKIIGSLANRKLHATTSPVLHGEAVNLSRRANMTMAAMISLQPRCDECARNYLTGRIKDRNGWLTAPEALDEVCLSVGVSQQ